ISAKSLASRGNRDLSAKLAVVGIGNKRNIAGMVKGKDPAFLTLLFSQCARGFDGTFRQPGKVAFIADMQTIIICFGQYILSKGELEFGRFVVYFAQS